MIVNLAVSSPLCFPDGEVGMMNSNLSHLEPVSAFNWAGYAVSVAAVVAIVRKQEAAAC